MEFKDNLIRIRREKGFSQESLASEIGVSRQAVSKWENGDAMPDLPKLMTLADVFGISIDTLCGRQVQEHTKDTVEASQPVYSKKYKLLGVLLTGVCSLALLFGAFYLGNWLGHTKEAMTLPDQFVISHVSFNQTPSGIVCTFVPSIVSGDYKYQIVYTDYTGVTHTVDTTCVDGICTGQLPLEQYFSYTLTAMVRKDNEVRSALLASDFYFMDGNGFSYTPAE